MLYYEDMRDDDDEGYDRSSMYFDSDNDDYDNYPMDGYEDDNCSEGHE